MTTSHTNPGPTAPSGGGGKAGRIVRVNQDLLAAAVHRLVGGSSKTPVTAGEAASRSREREAAPSRQAQQFIDYAAANGIRLDAMWALLDDRRQVAETVLAVPNPGRTAIFFASPPRRESDAAALGRVIDHACGAMAGTDVHLAQVLLEPHDALQREAFRAGGFDALAELSYLECPLPRRTRRDPPPLPTGATLEPYCETRRDEVLAVLDASYEDTLDCPGLLGLRDTEDILAGHRGTGAFDPALWTILRVEGTACGVLLLNHAPASNTLELVYMGLAKTVQRRGLGRLLLRHGLHRIAGRSERAVTLAVDERNEPAIALYRAEGFRRILRRAAMIRSLRPRRL